MEWSKVGLKSRGSDQNRRTRVQDNSKEPKAQRTPVVFAISDEPASCLPDNILFQTTICLPSAINSASNVWHDRFICLLETWGFSWHKVATNFFCLSVGVLEDEEKPFMPCDSVLHCVKIRVAFWRLQKGSHQSA